MSLARGKPEGAGLTRGSSPMQTKAWPRSGRGPSVQTAVFGREVFCKCMPSLGLIDGNQRGVGRMNTTV